MKIVVGTRASRLALRQTEIVVHMINTYQNDLQIVTKTIKTKGDILREAPLDKIGGKGVFVKEIEKELLEGKIDLAIHSMKDMPAVLPTGLKLSYVPAREDYRDVIVLREGLDSLDNIPLGGKIGTGSKRRKYQLLAYRPDLEIVPIRGNIDTRIKKIELEKLDGVVLAAAGINRLDMLEELKERICYLNREICLPSPCQGILALEIREGDAIMDGILRKLSDEKVEVQAKAERGFLKGVGGSCQIPIGAYCQVLEDGIVLEGLLGTDDGRVIARDKIEGNKEMAEELGYSLATHLVKEIDVK